MGIAGKIAAYRRRQIEAYVSIDTIGEGAGVYSRCIELDKEQFYHQLQVQRGGESTERCRDLTDITGQYKFLNMRAYLFWCIRDWLNPRNNTGGDASA